MLYRTVWLALLGCCLCWQRGHPFKTIISSTYPSSSSSICMYNHRNIKSVSSRCIFISQLHAEEGEDEGQEQSQLSKFEQVKEFLYATADVAQQLPLSLQTSPTKTVTSSQTSNTTTTLALSGLQQTYSLLRLVRNFVTTSNKAASSLKDTIDYIYSTLDPSLKSETIEVEESEVDRLLKRKKRPIPVKSRAWRNTFDNTKDAVYSSIDTVTDVTKTIISIPSATVNSAKAVSRSVAEAQSNLSRIATWTWRLITLQLLRTRLNQIQQDLAVLKEKEMNQLVFLFKAFSVVWSPSSPVSATEANSPSPAVATKMASTSATPIEVDPPKVETEAEIKARELLATAAKLKSSIGEVTSTVTKLASDLNTANQVVQSELQELNSRLQKNREAQGLTGQKRLNPEYIVVKIADRSSPLAPLKPVVDAVVEPVVASVIVEEKDERILKPSLTADALTTVVLPDEEADAPMMAPNVSAIVVDEVDSTMSISAIESIDTTTQIVETEKVEDVIAIVPEPEVEDIATKTTTLGHN